MSTLIARQTLMSIWNILSILIFVAAILISGSLLCRLMTDVARPEIPAAKSLDLGR
jgi:hypothetical protein